MASTVLVVEDERKLRDLVRSYLERAGFTVLSTDSGAEGMTMALASAPGETTGTAGNTAASIPRRRSAGSSPTLRRATS